MGVVVIGRRSEILERFLVFLTIIFNLSARRDFFITDWAKEPGVKIDFSLAIKAEYSIRIVASVFWIMAEKTRNREKRVKKAI